MSRRQNLEALKELADVRVLQERAGELAVRSAAVEVDRLARAEGEAVQARRLADELWLGQLGPGPLRLELSRAFSGGVLTAASGLTEAMNARVAGEDVLEDRRQALQRSQAQSEAARTVRDRAARKATRYEEERRLAELADRAASGARRR